MRVRRGAAPQPATSTGTDPATGGVSQLVRAGVLLGLGIGGFFDGIVLHQILQWHHMLTSAGYSPKTVAGLEVNTLWDGLFHLTTYVFTLGGLAALWRAGRSPRAGWSGRVLGGSMLVGFGLFNLVEGLVDHHLLGIHHVRDDVADPLPWDVGFLLASLVLVAVGVALAARRGRARPV